MPIAPLTEEQFCDWVAEAAAGECIVYHEGLLSHDRARKTTGYDKRGRQRVDRLADRVQKACETGLVHLFSQRIGEYVYRYYAVKAVPPRPLNVEGVIEATDADQIFN